MTIRYLRLLLPGLLLPGLLCCLGMTPLTAQDGPSPKAGTPPAPTPRWRPVYHYTPLENWTNDPNGLLYLNGEYLLYNQYNPFDYKWGHMSWGHAVSRDLIHWKHLSVAIPEIMGRDTTLRFSGSAVWDRNNSSGFCTSPKGCLVAIYTADQPRLKRESQFIAYSNDGGLTFANYDKNPVIDLHMRDFRDPNVIWLEKEKEWLMTVALPPEHKVRFYGSHNLRDWELLSEFGGDQGDTRKIWECPSLTPLPVDGSPSDIKWLLMVSSGNPDAATGMQYFVGDFDGKTFTNSYPAYNKQFVDYGSTYYAAIPWNNLPPGQLSHGRLLEKEDQKVTDGEMALDVKVIANQGSKGNADRAGGNAYWIKAELAIGSAAEAGFRIARKKDAAGNVLTQTIIGYDAASHQLYIRGDKINQHMPLEPVDGVLRLQILLDKSSLEVFADEGEKVLTTMIYPPDGADGLSLFAAGGDIVVKDLKLWNLAQ
jgi:fructan beta-fructosidase